MCRGSRLRRFLDLGVQPLAGRFLTPDKLTQKEPAYPLEVYFCEECKLVQLVDVVPKEEMFTEYFYSPHAMLSPHWKEYAEELVERFDLGPKSLVVEFGSNDGTYMKYLTSLGPRGIGVEPARNIAAISREKGVETVNDFFTGSVAASIAKRSGKADIIVANNVFAHIDDLEEVMQGIRALLKPGGVFVFENHYLLETVRRLQYDDIYHEHLCYYSLLPVVSFFRKHGMDVLGAKPVETHGGSIRVICGWPGMEVEDSVERMLAEERKAGLDRFETFDDFGARVRAHREKVVSMLKGFKAQGKRLAGYGAPARGNTLLNYCGIGTDLLDYTTDENPLRQGKFTPGTHIPVVSPEVLRKERPDYAFLLAWGGYTEGILKKEQKFIEEGGKFIIPLPEPKVVP